MLMIIDCINVCDHRSCYLLHLLGLLVVLSVFGDKGCDVKSAQLSEILLFVLPSTIDGGGIMFLTFHRLICQQSLCDVISLFSGRISVKLSRNIYHVSGKNQKGFQSER